MSIYDSCDLCLICLFCLSSVVPVPQNPLCAKVCKRQGTIKSGFCASEFGMSSALHVLYNETVYLTEFHVCQWSRERWPLWPTGQEALFLSACQSSRPTRPADWPSHKSARPCRLSWCHSAGSAHCFVEVPRSQDTHTRAHWLLSTPVHINAFF